MPVEDVLNQLRNNSSFMENVSAWEQLPARPAHYAPFPESLDLVLIRILEEQGTTPLYTHQAEAVKAALSGQNVVIETGTASGKTLCYTLPVLQMLLADRDARALYLFPTKALAQDQSAALAGFQRSLAPGQTVTAATYDGDTPQSQRRRIREDVRILITNPDMLHLGILPHHTRWVDFFENLRWVVIDELHVYRGIFGSNVANVLRRLRRLCRFYGSDPKFILTSATIANPKELAEKLIEQPAVLVSADLDGSPRAEKQIIVYNPPVVDQALGIRRSYTLEATRIAGQFLEAKVQTVVFARARLTTEIVLGYLRDTAVSAGLEPDKVRGYRGGYLPLERREIENGLREGSVLGVVATNALELGVDIGQLGAAVVAGYPGTIASLWQQTGRAGRRSELSAAVLVASAAPLDQFIALHPRYMFERSPEAGLINPDNIAILLRHLRCAAFELPFNRQEKFGPENLLPELLDFLVEEGEIHAEPETYHWVADTYPSEGVSLRASSDDTIVIQAAGEQGVTVIGEVDRDAAPILIYEGAVYIHEGATYMVQKLDWENAVAFVEEAEIDFYTRSGESVDLDVLETYEADEHLEARRAFGRVQITAQSSSFRKIKRYTHETLGYGQIDLPPRQYETTAYWLWIAPDAVKRMEEEGILVPPNDYGPSWPAAREQVLRRDGYRCRQCCAPERAGRGHHVHHLTPFRTFGYHPGVNNNDRLANDPENLITLCPVCHQRAEAAYGTRTALGGLSYAMGNIAPLFLMCDPGDVGSHAEVRSSETGGPAITLYDRIPDGLGLSERLYDLHTELLEGVRELIESCRCQEGCPACVGPVGIGGEEVKLLTVRLVKELLQPSRP
ncbi:MAG: DEAD/DEAH box helicase [Anaerolineales bacterium]|nr:DEAD/DEAH box helicase [Anaerolineales bacterium]